MTTMLCANSNHKSFGSVEVLKGVSLTANKGDVILMISSSGSGKSAFLRCLNFLERPTSGTIALDPAPLACPKDRPGGLIVIDEAELRAYRARVTMVFRQFNLWAHMAAREKVMLGPPRAKGLTRSEAGERAYLCPPAFVLLHAF